MYKQSSKKQGKRPYNKRLLKAASYQYIKKYPGLYTRNKKRYPSFLDGRGASFCFHKKLFRTGPAKGSGRCSRKKIYLVVLSKIS
ncbi:hypothetical protein CVD28_11345 [Bacillus sp. M6-12]|nr:hypothetical protein CVD28_11345 [Bacillus sp. M6-12]